MEVDEIAPGIWRWTAAHPEWRPDVEWAREVASFAFAVADTLVLVRRFDEDRFTVETLHLEALLGSARPTGGVGYGRSRGSRKGSSSSGCPPEIALPRASSAFISAPRRSATFEIQSQTRKMMIAPRLPYVLL